MRTTSPLSFLAAAAVLGVSYGLVFTPRVDAQSSLQKDGVLLVDKQAISAVASTESPDGTTTGHALPRKVELRSSASDKSTNAAAKTQDRTTGIFKKDSSGTFGYSTWLRVLVKYPSDDHRSSAAAETLYVNSHGLQLIDMMVGPYANVDAQCGEVIAKTERSSLSPEDQKALHADRRSMKNPVQVRACLYETDHSGDVFQRVGKEFARKNNDLLYVHMFDCRLTFDEEGEITFIGGEPAPPTQIAIYPEAYRTRDTFQSFIYKALSGLGCEIWSPEGLPVVGLL